MTGSDRPADRSADPQDGPGGTGGSPDGDRRDNGLRAVSYVPLTDVPPDVGRHLLTALARARIAAYVDPDGAVRGDRHRLHVAAEERGDARTIVAAVLRSKPDPAAAPGAAPGAALNTEPAGGAAAGGAAADGSPGTEPLRGADTDAAFRELVANWKIDTVAAVRAAERDLSREDADWRLRLNHPQPRDEVWLDDDHYVPPVPPPLPRLAAPTVVGMIVLVLSLFLLGFGGLLGFADDARLVLGIGGLLVTAGILLSRVREHRRDEDDDGSAV